MAKTQNRKRSQSGRSSFAFMPSNFIHSLGVGKRRGNTFVKMKAVFLLRELQGQLNKQFQGSR